MSKTPPQPRRSLVVRWTAALLSAGALPLVLLGFATLSIQRRGLEIAEKRHEVAVTDHVADLVERTLTDAAETTRRIARLLGATAAADADVRLGLSRRELSPTLLEVAVYGPDGALIDAIRRAGAAVPAPPRTLAPPATSEGEGDGWLPPTTTPGAAPGERPLTWLRFRAPIPAPPSAAASPGFVLGTLDPDALTAPLQALSRDRFEGRTDAVFLIDARGQVLFGEGQGPALGETVLSPGLFTREFALTAEFRGPGPAGEPMVGTVRTLPQRRLGVVVRTPARQVFAALEPTRRSVLLSCGALLLLALVGGVVLARRATAPVRALVDLCRAYGRREFDRRSPVGTGDELEELGTALSGMADELQRSELEVARRARVEAALSRYLPEGLARSVAASGAPLRLGGERRVVTVLFADVAAFTPFAEQAPPERVVALLNELFSVLTEVVFRHGGTVDKFIGDCVMAIFGAPEAQPDHAARALAAAEDMQRFAEASAPDWRRTYGADVRLAIGISTGEALVGNLGSERRMEYTAIGDVVNTAARLEGLARPGQTLLSADTASAAGAGFVLQALGAHPLRGKQRPVQVFQLGTQTLAGP